MVLAYGLRPVKWREGGEGLPYDEFLTGVSVTESSLELYRSAIDHPTDNAKGSSLKS